MSIQVSCLFFNWGLIVLVVESWSYIFKPHFLTSCRESKKFMYADDINCHIVGIPKILLVLSGLSY